MDKSETNIKMCERAEEIQKSHQWLEGDYGWDGTPDAGYCLLVTNKHLTAWEQEDEGYPGQLIWLPRQDKLQEMVGDFEAARDLIVGYFSNMDEQPFLFKDSEIKYWESFTSMEQLWLAFVMKEKYNKTWNGEGWI